MDLKDRKTAAFALKPGRQPGFVPACPARTPTPRPRRPHADPTPVPGFPARRRALPAGCARAAGAGTCSWGAPPPTSAFSTPRPLGFGVPARPGLTRGDGTRPAWALRRQARPTHLAACRRRGAAGSHVCGVLLRDRRAGLHHRGRRRDRPGRRLLLRHRVVQVTALPPRPCLGLPAGLRGAGMVLPLSPRGLLSRGAWGEMIARASLVGLRSPLCPGPTGGGLVERKVGGVRVVRALKAPVVRTRFLPSEVRLSEGAWDFPPKP